MQLKRIVLSGFKSFADKLSLDFDDGITGIVGPNGSGKSNVIDAVRWVMGEQNAKNLRGDKATDIIFAGSEKRKALGMAEVSLVFDNSKGSSFCPPEYRHEPEITVTRRLYIDGQREYLINRKPCRLKDVADFFALSGLGGRNYSMIQQGQVDRILNSKPEDIREMLEDAAGTLLYKKRKIEAEKKLEATQLNLSRIDDILRELERQKDSLKEQVDKATKWKKASDELRDVEIHYFAHNYRHFHDEKLKLEVQLTGESEAELKLMQEISELEQRQSLLNEELEQASPEIQKIAEEIATIREQIARHESAMLSAIEKLSSSDQRVVDIQEELGGDEGQLEKLKQDYETAAAKKEHADLRLAQLSDRVETLNAELENIEEQARTYDSKFDEFKEQLENLSRLLQSNVLRQESLQRELRQAASKHDAALDRLDGLELDLQESSSWLAEAEAKLTAEKTGLSTELQRKHQLESELSQVLEDLDQKKTSSQELRENAVSYRTRLDALSEMETTSQSLQDVLAVLETISGLEGEFAALPDLLILTEQATQLPPAFLKAFDRWSSRILLRDEFSLRKLCNAAADAELSDFALSLLRSPNAAKEPGELGTGSTSLAELKSWAAKHRLVALSDSIRVKPHALTAQDLIDRLFLLPEGRLRDECLKEMPFGAVLFDSSGLASLNPGDFIFTGRKSASGALTRRYEIESLQEKLQISEGQISILEQDIRSLQVKTQQLSEATKTIDSGMENQNQNLMELMADYQSYQSQVDQKKSFISRTREEVSELESATSEFQTEYDELLSTYEALSEEKRQYEGDFQELKDQAADMIDRRLELKRLQESANLEIAGAKASVEGIELNYRTMREQYQVTENRVQRRRDELSKLREAILRYQQEETDAKGAIEQLVLRREDKQGELIGLQDENAGLIEALRVVENGIRQCRSTQDKNQKLYSEQKIRLERATIAIAGVIEQAMERYHLDITTYAFKPDEDFDAQAAHKQTNRLRAQIETMGPINMMAVEEYENLTKRESFIFAQKDEVISSIHLLGDAIEEVAETSKEKFMETYLLVNQHFGELFPILFRGGEARLEIIDPNNPLDSGIDIICRLPGKKYRKMSLFSGGEKALTAISLIFALLKTKPTPFCFLDEVDAPLDETNVGRYNNVLQVLADRFQFIVITHNRRTMEVLDTLYGVTMQEPGVSKVVGVDMNRELPAHLKKAFKEDPRPVEGASVQ
jgi:chromosome segregation protein